MGIAIDDGFMRPKPPTVETRGTSTGGGTADASGRFAYDNGEGGIGRDEGSQGEFAQIPHWLGDFTFYDIPPRTKGASRPSIEAQLANI
ncbi:hypothetical protein LIER_12892 [Lithospermum erythrorhizon]|uniref:Uncharacterized protein n=1 Tax=Lithospermum erythrorhizon TaxID=34254 RepID=A0AAV3PVW2_LITER